MMTKEDFRYLTAYWAQYGMLEVKGTRNRAQILRTHDRALADLYDRVADAEEAIHDYAKSRVEAGK